MDDSLRYGIVGCAGIGNTHAEAIADVEDADLVACADVNEDAAREFVAEHAPDAETHAEAGEMVRESDVEAVSVCTPSGTHADVACEAAEAGAHVLCEKPLDVYRDRIDRMIDTCKREGVTLAGVYQKRFEPHARRAKRAIEEGELGDPVSASLTVDWFRSQPYYDSGEWRGTRSMDGGVLLNQAIHAIDRLQWLLGGVESVSAMTDTLAREMESEDTAAIAVRFESGALGTIQATTATKGGSRRTEVNATEGTLEIEGGELSIEVGTGEESYYGAETESLEVEGVAHDCGAGHVGVVRDFVEAIRTGREPEVPAREARVAVDTILAAYDSSETGERIEL
ncbi:MULTISPECIES: Gfo/Idh/MocA family protein [Saliphagus]|uniref:Gfo/Idh/MocA family protein n=1 Tax=Saliphagus infecundisoli TaxID=1849069 RepID=A0ABD5QFK9_9EURY|nr:MULTISPECIES: Gfo/Idh/MocA family oxidoreductase [Saliphagus]